LARALQCQDHYQKLITDCAARIAGVPAHGTSLPKTAKRNRGAAAASTGELNSKKSTQLLREFRRARGDLVMERQLTYSCSDVKAFRTSAPSSRRFLFPVRKIFLDLRN